MSIKDDLIERQLDNPSIYGPFSKEQAIDLFNEYKFLKFKMSRILAEVYRQAEDETIWAIPIARLQTIMEASLQKELRFIHKVIETTNCIEYKPDTSIIEKEEPK